MISAAMICEILPLELRGAFLSDTEVTSRSVAVASEFAKWFDVSGVPFFKKYTDHSTRHSLDVFRSACEFMSKDSYAILSNRDIATLLTACFCHDAGMHLTEVQFLKLIEQKEILVKDLDQRSWHELWKEYLSEARRFSKRTLVGIFGDDTPLTEVPSNAQDFTDRHRMLIGEFLRRHHPRLAHDLASGLASEIGLHGLFGTFDAIERDIVGLLSRSHGCSIRSLFPYMEKKYDLRDYNNTHLVFLMCLLGIADYTQLQPSRAPIMMETVHVIESPISRKEWRVHRGIKNINLTHSDPEAIYVYANPVRVDDYLRLKEWLDGIQTALDTAWAILGEVYGRYTQNKLDKLSLSLRRVRSSIADCASDFNLFARENQIQGCRSRNVSAFA